MREERGESHEILTKNGVYFCENIYFYIVLLRKKVFLIKNRAS